MIKDLKSQILLSYGWELSHFGKELMGMTKEDYLKTIMPEVE